MKKLDLSSIAFMATIAVIIAMSAIVLVAMHDLSVKLKSVDEDGKAICALTGNERTRSYPVLAGKVTIMQTVQEQEYHCAPGKLYWVAK